MPPNQIDEIDRRILAHLQRHARASLPELSKIAYLSPPQCYRRVKRLEQNGIIRGYVALLDRDKLGLSVMAMVGLVRDKNHSQGAPAFDRLMRQFPEVIECHTVTGDFDYLLKVVAKDLKDFNDFLNGKLLRVPGVVSTRSNLYLEEIKHSTVLPIDMHEVKERVKSSRQRRKPGPGYTAGGLLKPFKK